MVFRLNRWFVAVLCASLVVICLASLPGQVSNAQQTCPPVPEPRTTGASMERFERGYLVWVQDMHLIYVLYDPSGLGRSGTVEIYPDTFQDGMPETDPSLNPPPGKFQPTRGFGLLWRTNARVQNGLGWGTEPSTGYTVLIETRGDKTWFNGQGYDAFVITGNTWQEIDVWRK
jgi:hypothetical protein